MQLTQFQLLYKNYCKLAKLSRRGLATPEQIQKRIEFKNLIVEYILIKDKESLKLVKKATSDRTFWGKTYSEISALYTDGNAFGEGDRREASLVESLYQSYKLNRLATEIGKMLEPYCIVGFLCGSLVHSLYFSIKNNSDIDLVLVIDINNINKILNLPLFDEEREHLISNIKFFSDPNIIEWFIKIKYKNEEVGIYLIQKEVFEITCRFNVCHDQPMQFSSLRIKPRVSAGLYSNRYTFDGIEYSWDCLVNNIEKVFLIHYPLFKVSETGKFINGLIFDRYITSNFIIGDHLYLNNELYQLKLNLVKRLIHEENLGIIRKGEGKLYNILSRHKYFPRFYTQILLEEEIKIRTTINSY
ncbi:MULTISPECIES: hypothetical protein [Kamptonema]|uniref:hypothetical protein n=1 Tax=Kamptonema TaxID=1501433 RepID=UPI0001DAD10F|nr:MULTISPECIES: hypothetical protein [Kamptonema]CBN58805.1 hypothetical protein OSCI_3890021 [Kamptonema sp. PCC 6506]